MSITVRCVGNGTLLLRAGTLLLRAGTLLLRAGTLLLRAGTLLLRAGNVPARFCLMPKHCTELLVHRLSSRRMGLAPPPPVDGAPVNAQLPANIGIADPQIMQPPH